MTPRKTQHLQQRRPVVAWIVFETPAGKQSQVVLARTVGQAKNAYAQSAKLAGQPVAYMQLVGRRAAGYDHLTSEWREGDCVGLDHAGEPQEAQP